MRHYLGSLVKAMSVAEPANELVIFESPRIPLHEFDDLANVVRVACPGLPRARAARVLYQNSIWPLLLRRQHIDVTLGTCNVVPLGNPRPYVVVLQSLQYFVHGGTFGALRGTYLRAAVSSSVRRADAVIALSRASRDELASFTGIDPTRVFVVYHGVPSSVRHYADSHAAPPPPETPYVLSVSSLHRYKNVERVLRAYAEVRRRCTVPHRLRVIGQSAEVTIDELHAVARETGVAESVDFVGGVSHAAMAEHYAGASMLVYASLHETFGLPPLEAMALGCPVVVSRQSAMPEVVGDAGELVDPLDVGDIARGIERVAVDNHYRDELIRRGLQRAAGFTWERTAAQTLAVMHHVVSRGRPIEARAA
jgi:alpha-1,3-rhamnosyl/mannosyltransferase